MKNILKFIGKFFLSFIFVMLVMHIQCGISILEQHEWNIKKAYKTIKKVFIDGNYNEF
jgi:hypothetical protein